MTPSCAALIAGAITKGDVTVTDVQLPDLIPLIEKLKACGLIVTTTEDSVRVQANGSLHPVDVETLPFPGFPRLTSILMVCQIRAFLSRFSA